MKNILLVIAILCVNQTAESYRLIRKIGQQKDVSEHCRRRVVPSVFLGRQVAESSAEVLHFSRLEVPYSCSISIRTESGSNIILLVQLNSKKSLIKSCNIYPEQLLIYEIGETFGGYWAAISKSMFREDSDKARNETFYTLKTTQPTVSTDDGQTEGITKSTKEVLSLSSPEDETEGNYVVMEVPLVNVSGTIEFAKSDLRPSAVEELFDSIYDVSPKNGVNYETTVVPIVQFSISKTEQRRDNFENLEPRYQLDYNIEGLTPDYRLMYRTNNYRRKFSNRPFHSTRRLRYKKKSKKLFAANNRSNYKYQVTSNTRFKFNTQSQFITKSLTTTVLNKKSQETTYENYTDDWQELESYLKSLNVKNSTNDPGERKDVGPFALSNNITSEKEIVNGNMFYTFCSTIGLLFFINCSNDLLYKYTMITEKVTSSINNEPNSTLKLITETPQVILNNNTILVTNNENTRLYTAKHNFTQEITTNTINIYKDLQTKEFKSKTTVLHSRLKNYESELIKQNTRKSEVGSLVDHESWENVVQVAPVIADLLNVTQFKNDTTFITRKKSKYTTLMQEKIKRKKRYIKALPIYQNRPRQITMEEDGFTTRGISDFKFDSQDLAESVELQDDEIQGRVALRYFGSYVGSAIFNICDFHEAKARHVYLLNSSRVIISINNFMMDSMTIVLTESRVTRAAGCPTANLECQVSGVRVCVHHINACDGVPNCGSYDIYDEDRLLCGDNVGFQYRIVVAACTFLVVVLTVLYSVHYWLRRCVPKVSQAFFVYADKSENILYLDSIMRSPMDFDGGSKLVYNSSFFDDDILSTDSNKEDHNKIISVLKTCLNFFRCKKPKRHISEEIIAQEDLEHSLASDVKRKFSFTEAELRRIAPNARDASIQTGDSLEMAYLRKVKGSSLHKHRPRHDQSRQISDQKENYSPQQSANELKTLRRIRDMSASLQSSSESGTLETARDRKVNLLPVEEVELQSTEYDRPGKSATTTRNTLVKTSCEIHSEPQEQKGTTSKHLRFEEGATTIPSSGDEEVEVEERRKVVLGVDKHIHIDQDSIEEMEEAGSSTGRDFMRFWGGKTKKGKKKTRVPLPNK
ncbi:uncharacterized protein [Epargyreus clarus]|uniref:uncharacterized protein n=1 Tax=Epargyreus clarus TaxID=520877 RepID=UPI003C2F28F6